MIATRSAAQARRVEGHQYGAVVGIARGANQLSDLIRTEDHRLPIQEHYDRIAAVRGVAGETPVEGRIVFTRRGKFPKGLPKYTLMVDSLKAEFPEGGQTATGPFADGWGKVKKSVTPSYMAHMR